MTNLMLRDERHMEQDSMLVDLEDLTRYLYVNLLFFYRCIISRMFFINICLFIYFGVEQECQGGHSSRERPTVSVTQQQRSSYGHKVDDLCQRLPVLQS